MSSFASYSAVDDYITGFNTLIALNEGFIRTYKKWIVASLLTGFVTICAAVFLYARVPGMTPSIVAIGGIFIGGSSTFPLLVISPRHTDNVKYLLVKRQLEKYNSLTDEEQKRALDLADGIIRK